MSNYRPIEYTYFAAHHERRNPVTSLTDKISRAGLFGAAVRLANRAGTLAQQGFERDLLITGCGASGTKFVAAALESNGVSVTHDCGLGRHGIVTNACDGKDVWILWHGRLGAQEYVQAKIPVTEFQQRLRLVRHPLKVIGSVTEKWRLHGKIWRHVRETLADSLDFSNPFSLTNGCRYWLDWNQRLESVTYDTLRIEDITQKPQILFDRIGRRLWRTHELQLLSGTNTSGTHSYPTWDQIKHLDPRLHDELKIQARALNYSE